MNAGQLCTRNVVISPRGSTVTEAARLMRKFDVGNVVIVDDDNGARTPIGIVTDRDITVQLVAQRLDPDGLDVDEIMLREIVTVDEETAIDEVARTMKSNGVRRTPVVNRRGGLEGILAFDDIIDILAEQMMDLAKLVQRQQQRQKRTLQGDPSDTDQRP